MLEDRVRDTSTTSGTGNLTLSGTAATGDQTFNSAFGTNRPFTYVIYDSTAGTWETGIGHLSASTTLVRDTVMSNSSGTTALINFAANSKDVFCDRTAYANEFTRKISNSGINFSQGWYMSDHIPFDNLSDVTAISGNKVFCVPLRWYGGLISEMGTLFTTTIGSATKFRLGIYEMSDLDAEPGALLAETGDLTPVVNTFVSGSLGTAVTLPAGWYYTAYLDDAGARLRGQNGSSVTCTPMGMRGGTTVMNYLTDSIASGWTAMPSSLVINDAQHTAAFPRIEVK